MCPSASLFHRLVAGVLDTAQLEFTMIANLYLFWFLSNIMFQTVASLPILY